MRILLLITGLIYSQITMAFPPVGAVGLSGGTVLYPTVKKAPYNQVTNLGSGAVLIETGSENMLVDGGMEALGTSAWTCAFATCTKTSASGEFSSGNQALKIAMSASNFNLSQNVSTPAGIQVQGVVGLLYRVPSTVTDFQICTLVGGSTQTCTTNILNDNKYHPIEIPVIMTPGSTVGVNAFTTASYTANVFIDAAYIKQGIGLQNLVGDTVYSAQVTTTSGAIANQTKSFIASCTAANPAVCTFNTGIFTVAPNCFPNSQNGGASIAVYAISSTGFTVASYTTSGAQTLLASIIGNVACQKGPTDYANASSAAYISSSSNTDIVYSAQVSSAGAVSNLSKTSWITSCTVASPSVCTYGSGITLTLGMNCVANFANGVQRGLNISSSSTSGVSVQEYLPSTNASITLDSPFSITCQKAGADYTLAQHPYVVGSFAGYTNVPGLSGGVDIFDASFATSSWTTNCTASPCSFLNQSGSGAVTSITRSATGQYAINTARTYSKLQCTGNTNSSGVSATLTSAMFCTSCSTLSFTVATPVAGQALVDAYGTLNCIGQW